MTLSSIRLLDDTTINQIAAGEVVEQAASVVKELVENALDAGASSILVETKGGGRGLIRVVDNGRGMGQDDLLLSIERHATSKIVKVGDLNSLTSLGFRGEALPSIASISKMGVHSAASTNGEGARLQIEGGKIVDLHALPRARGTTVEVKSLFFNVPARKKFQKSTGRETAEIHKILIQMALCHMDVGFTWINEELVEIETVAHQTLIERIALLLGEDAASKVRAVESVSESFLLKGYIGNAIFHRSNRLGQYLFVNDRFVVSPLIAGKITEGYGHRLPPHRHPYFVLHVHMPPALVDVNVHPQKKEVRFQEEERIGSFVLKAIATSLQGNEKPSLFFPSLPLQNEASTLSEPAFLYQTVALPNQSEERLLPLSAKKRVMGKIGNFLLVENEKGMFVVDGPAARARIFYEQMLNQKSAAHIQQLLLPCSLEITGAEKTLLLHSLQVFENLGFSIRHFGNDTFLIDAIPSFLEVEEIEPLIHHFLEEEKNEVKEFIDHNEMSKRLSKFLNKSVRTLEEGILIVNQLFQCTNPSESADGRPTFFLITEEELGGWLNSKKRKFL